MTNQIEIDSNHKPIKYAWPGGYPAFYMARNGYRDESGALELSRHDRTEAVCCADCAAKASEKDIILTHVNINWESEDLFCEFCSDLIESAYGETAD